MSNVQTIKPNVINNDARDRELLVKDLEELLAGIKDGSMPVAYGMFVYLRPDLHGSWFRVGSCNKIEGIGLIEWVKQRIYEDG